MIKFECPNCSKQVTSRDRRENGRRVGGFGGKIYCSDCYDKAWAIIVNKLMGEQGIAPMFEVNTDECPTCDGTGKLERFGSHSWEEPCLNCNGTGKEK